MANRYRMQYAGTFACLGLMLSLVIVPAGLAQRVTPEFEVDAVSARANGGSRATRLDVYTKIPYANLRFLSTPNGFTARYGVTVEAYRLDERNRPQNLIQSRIWEQAVVVADFAQTQTEQLFDRTVQTLELDPGRYLIQFQIEDQATNEAFVRELPVEVRDLSRPVALGDLILIDAYDAAANSITPSIGSQISTGQPTFRLFYEVYADRPQRVQITQEVRRVHSSTSTVKTLLGLDDEELDGAEVSYQQTEPRRLGAGRNQYVVEIPMSNIRVGEYVARVRVMDENGREIDVAEKRLVSKWSGLADHVRDLGEAIAQLTYIAKDKDLKYIREGRTETERMARFRDFWKKRDPTPGTERNERMEEYYYRIAYANHEYGSLMAGWKTDRGHVMVLFGEPDFVERHPYNYNVKPYEVWYYYTIGRRFIFVDKTGFGDFELLVPYWDERTRIR